MPSPSPSHTERGLDELRRQYGLERSLALELRRAGRERRERLYGKIYDRLFQQVPDLLQPAGAASRERQVRLQAQALTPFLERDSVFLEVGAGDCALALRLAARVGHVWAIDASVEATRGIRPPAGFELVVSGATRLRLADDSVDVAYSCHYLEHLHPEDAVDHAAEMRRVLKPQGRYVCVTPNRLWGPHDVSKHFDDQPRGLHLREYSFGDLIGLLRGAGFRRIAALRTTGGTSKIVSAARYQALEAVLEAIPPRARRWLMRSCLGAIGEAPLRPLEQVVLVARP